MTNNEACELAFAKAIDALRPEVSLPENIFLGSWSSFLFMDSDQLFSPHFVDAVRELIHAENAQAVCLVNIDRLTDRRLTRASAICLDLMTQGEDYDRQLRAGGPAGAWLFDVERYVCSSDVGRWCIYAEKQNDVAVIALRKCEDMMMLGSGLALLRADRLEALCGDQENRGRPPFAQLTRPWRDALSRHYASR